MNQERRQARILALKALYEQEFHYQKQHPFPGGEGKEAEGENPNTQNYSRLLFEGVCENKKSIDLLIQEKSHAWSLKRMSLIDLNIVRIAIYEMCYSSDPPPFRVCLNEAVEVARAYGTEKSFSFVNGLLDAVAENLPSAEKKPPVPEDGKGGTKKEKTAGHVKP